MISTHATTVIEQLSRCGTVISSAGLSLGYLLVLTTLLAITVAALAIHETLKRISDNYALRHKDDCYDL